MSFAFRVLRQEWNEDYTRRWINEVSLDKGDVSLVNYGANPTTGGTVSIRQRFKGHPFRLGGRAAADADNCNRCDGEGTIDLGGKSTTCPQCNGSGGSEGNAQLSLSAGRASTGARARLDAYLTDEADARQSSVRAHLLLAKLRYPPEGNPNG
jgi:DnaJ-class molecular chaperone